MASRCKSKDKARTRLIQDGVINSFNNIIDYNKYIIYKNKWTAIARKKYKIPGDPFVVDERHPNKLLFNMDYFNQVDDINEGRIPNNPLLNTFLGKTMNNVSQLDVSVESPKKGQYVIYRGDVFVFYGYTENGVELYNPEPLYEKPGMTIVDYNDVTFLTESAIFTTSDRSQYIVTPKGFVISNTGKVLSGVAQAKVIDRSYSLKTLDLSMEDVLLQLYDDSYKTLSYNDFVREVKRLKMIMQLSYTPDEIREAFKCL